MLGVYRSNQGPAFRNIAIVAILTMTLAITVGAMSMRASAASTSVTVKLVPPGYSAGIDELVVDISDGTATASSVIAAITTADSSETVAIVIPDASFEEIELGTATVDHNNTDFLAIAADLPLLGESDVSLLFVLDWQSDPGSDPEWAIGAKVGSLSLSTLNADWTLPNGADPTVSELALGLASADISYPDSTATAIADFFPEGFEGDSGVDIPAGAVLQGSIGIESIIGEEATQAIFGTSSYAVTLRAPFSATAGLFNLGDGSPPSTPPVDTAVSIAITLPLGATFADFPGYVKPVGDWTVSLDIDAGDGAFAISGGGVLEVSDVASSPVELDVELGVSYATGETTFSISTSTTKPIVNLFDTGVSLNSASFSATIVSGTTTSAEFELAGSINIGSATATASLGATVGAGGIETATVSLEVNSLNFGELQTWVTNELGFVPAASSTAMNDLTLTSASVTVALDFTGAGTSATIEADATMAFGTLANLSASLSMEIVDGALDTAEVTVALGDLNVGELSDAILDGLGLDATDVPAVLDQIELTSASLTIALDYSTQAQGGKLSVEVEASVEIGTATATANVSFVVQAGTLQRADLAFGLQSVNIGELTTWVADTFDVSSAGIPSELDDLVLTQASLRVGMVFGAAGDSAEIAARAEVTYNGFASPVTADLLLIVTDNTTAGPNLTVMLRVDSNLALKDIAPGIGDNPFGNTTLPEFVIGFSTNGITWDSSVIAPELADYLGSIYGCDTDPAKCVGVKSRNNVPDGAFLMSSFSLPEGLHDTVTGLSGDTVDPNDPVVLKGSVGSLFGGNDISVGVDILLPAISPPAPVNQVIDEASLRIALRVDGTGFTASLEGELIVWLPTDPEPVLGNQDHYQRSKVLVAADLTVDATGVGVTVTGALMPADGETSAWATPFGQEWITINSLAVQVGISVETSGAIQLSLGLGGDVQLTIGNIQKDVEASFEVDVEIRPIPGPPGVVVTVKPNGFRIASAAGLEFADVIRLYNLIATDMSGMLETNMPPITMPPGWEEFNVGIKDIELGFALETNARLCLFQGLRIKGDLYLGPESIGHIPAQNPSGDCVFGATTNTPRAVTPGGSCTLGENADYGCFAGVDIAVSIAGLQATASMGPVEIGPVHLQNTFFEIMLTTTQQHLKLSGGVVVEGVAEGNVDIFIEPTGFAFLAEMDLLAALFRARIQGDGGLSLDNPSFHIKGEMQTSFGHQTAAAFQPVAEPLSATLVSVNVFVQALADPNTGVDGLVDVILDLPSKLRTLGYTGAALELAEDIADEIRAVRDDAQAAGFSVSIDDALNALLGGNAIQFDGVAGSWRTICVGVYVPETDLWDEDCLGSWERVCFAAFPVPGIPLNGSCWVIPPFTLTVPSLCDVLDLDINPCTVGGLKSYLLTQLNTALNQVIGITVNDVVGSLNAVVTRFQQNPVIFDLRCAAFDFDVEAGGVGAPADASFYMNLHFILMGYDIYLRDIGWNFTENPITNLNALKTSLLQALFQDPAASFECDLGTQIGTSTPTVEPPSNLQLTVSPNPVAEGQTLDLSGSFDAGTAQSGDTVTVSITWPDHHQETLTLSGTDSSFSASRLIVDNRPSGQPSSNGTLTVVVENTRTGSTSAQQAVTVQNVAPTLGTISLTYESAPATEIDEGDTVTLSGSFTDPGVQDTHRVRIDWGDGTSQELYFAADASRSFEVSHTYVDGTYDSNGDASVRSISVDVVDKDTGSDSETLQLTVNNVAPAWVPGSVQFNSVELDGDGNVVPGSRVEDVTGISEGSVVEIVGKFTDPGLADWHTVVVDWGDSNYNDQFGRTGVPVPPGLQQPGERSFRAYYIYADDDPSTGTPFDTMEISVIVTDKDGDSTTEETTLLTVNNVAPSVDLALASSDINENETASLTIDISDPGVLDTYEVELDWGDGKSENFSVGSIALEPTTLPDGTVVRRIVREHQYLDDNPTGTPVDDYIINVKVTDDDTGFGNNSIVQTVHNTDPRLASNSHPDLDHAAEVQYSDPLDDPVHSPDANPLVVIFDDVEADTMWAVTSYTFNGGPAIEGLPGDLVLVPAAGRPGGEVGSASSHCETTNVDGLPDPRIACTWTIDGRAMVEPGHYVITVAVTDDDTGVSTTDLHLVVHPEDAEATYTGPTTVSAPSLHDGYIDVMLRATVRDISVIEGHPLWDPYEGDITNAMVTFINLDSGEVLCTTQVTRIFPDDTTTGGAACEGRLELADGQTERSVDVEIVVGGWYTNERSEAQPTSIRVVRPTGDFITGGDFVMLTGAAGTHAPSGRTQLQSQVKWGRPGFDSLDGHMRIRFDAAGRSWEIDATSFTSLGIDRGGGNTGGIAQLEALANLVDRTPRSGTTVKEEVHLQLRIVDRGGTAEIAFALWDHNGLLLAANGWDVDHVPDVPLNGGNAQVHEF